MPRPSWRALPAAEQQRLLDAAMEEFGQLGFSGASLAVIGTQAGLDGGWLRRHFDDRYDLYRTATVWAVLTARDRMRVSFDAARELPVTERVQLLMEAWMNFTAGTPVVRGMLAAASMELDPGVRRVVREPWRRAFLDAAEPVLADALRAGGIRPDTDVQALLSLFALVTTHVALAPFEPGLNLAVAMHGQPVRDRLQLARRLVDTLLAGVVR